MPLGQREQAGPRCLLALDGVGEPGPATRADLYLGLDQLARHRVGQDLVVLRRFGQLLVALGERLRGRIEDPELLFEPDREVLGGLEDLVCLGHVEHVV